MLSQQDLTFAAVTASSGLCVMVCASVWCWRDFVRRSSRQKDGALPKDLETGRPVHLSRTPAALPPVALRLLGGYQAPVRRLDPWKKCGRTGNNSQKLYSKVTALAEGVRSDNLARAYGSLAGGADDDTASVTSTPRTSARSRSSDLAAELQGRGRAGNLAPSRGSRSASSSESVLVPGSAPSREAPRGSASSRPPSRAGAQSAGRRWREPAEKSRAAAAASGELERQESAEARAASSSGVPGHGRREFRSNGAAGEAQRAPASSWGARTAAAVQRLPPGASRPPSNSDPAAASASQQAAAALAGTAAAPRSPRPAVLGRTQPDSEAADPAGGREAAKAKRTRGAATAPGLLEVSCPSAGDDLLSQIELPAAASGGEGGRPSPRSGLPAPAEAAAASTAAAAPPPRPPRGREQREAKFAALDAELTLEAQAEVKRAISFMMDSSAFPLSSEGLPVRPKAAGRGKAPKRGKKAKPADEAKKLRKHSFED